MVEWVKKNNLRWCGHTEGMKNEEFIEKVHLSETEGLNGRGRSVRWKAKVGQHICEAGTGRVEGSEEAEKMSR